MRLLLDTPSLSRTYHWRGESALAAVSLSNEFTAARIAVITASYSTEPVFSSAQSVQEPMPPKTQAPSATLINRWASYVYPRAGNRSSLITKSDASSIRLSLEKCFSQPSRLVTANSKD